MSGPVTTADTADSAGNGGPVAPGTTGGTGATGADGRLPGWEVTPSRSATLAGLPLHRALPRRGRRTVGGWCLVDHVGPHRVVDAGSGMRVGPHPHTGLQTVTWLLDGELRHRDSLGSDQLVRPGQLNLMSAGDGVVHAEESLGYRGPFHGVQLWVAQPAATRRGPAAFEHHPALPSVRFGGATGTVLVGEVAGVASPARADTPLVGVDLVVPDGPVAPLPLRPDFEHAVVVLQGAVHLGPAGHAAAGAGGPLEVRPGSLAYLGTGRDSLTLSAPEPCRLLLLGGEPFPDPLHMWWNFVAGSRAEIDAAAAAWADTGTGTTGSTSTGGSGRFGPVESALPRVPVPPRPWTPRGAAG